MSRSFSLEPPFLVFGDQKGGFLIFHDPVATFPGAEIAKAEALAQERGGWIAGGLEYHLAEQPGPGWWGVFDPPRTALLADLEVLADPDPVVTGPLSSHLSFRDYEEAFDLVRGALASGTSYQVNLTFFLEGVAVSGPPWSWRSALRLWLELVAHQGREASFAVLGDGERPAPILVSASPEVFFFRHGPIVEARPMKGTALRDSDPIRDAMAGRALLNSSKTRAENLMVTDMLRNDLGRLAVPGGVTVPRLFELEPYPTVWQMTSTVRAEVGEELSLASLMAALFPCASITGAPKLSTQAVIARAEAQPRSWYTGTLGWHKPASVLTGATQSRFSVLIRTLIFENKTPAFRLGVGGGVVWDSTASSEWDEAWAKSRFLAPSQREFSLTEAILWEPGTGYFLWEEHEARLAAACRDFGGHLNPGSLVEVLDAETARCQTKGHQGALKLRVLVGPDFSLRAEGEPVSDLPEVLTAALAPRPFGPETLLWRRYKTTNRRIYEDNRAAGVDQTLHYNERGELTESTSMTLVLEKDGVFSTPALASGLLDGTYRARLIAEGKLVEAVLPVEALAAADRVWLINSVRRWKRVRLVTK